MDKYSGDPSVSVRLPEKIVTQIEEVVENNPVFKNRSDVVRSIVALYFQGNEGPTDTKTLVLAKLQLLIEKIHREF